MVATWGDRLEKKGLHLLGPDEEFRAGLLYQGQGQMKKQMLFGVFGLIGALLSQSRKKKAEDTLGAPATIASTLPTAAVVGLTGRRLLFFKSVSQKNMAAPLLELPLSDITGFSVEEKGTARNMTIQFTDGSEFAAETLRASKPDLFFDALGETVPRAT